MATVSQEDADKLVKILAQYGKTDSKAAAQKVVDAGGIEAAKKTLPPKTSAAAPSPATPRKDTSVSDAVGNSLPAAENRSSLVEFADTLNKATSLARDRRQASELGILEDYGFKPGQVRAGTMGSVLNLLQSRADTSYGTLQNAAVSAYENEEKRKAADVQNRQALALQLLTSGKLDETGVAGIINATDFNSALSAAAGMIKAGNSDIEDIRTIDNKIIAIKSDGTTEVIYEGDGVSDGGQFTLSSGQVRYDSQGNVIAQGSNDSPKSDRSVLLKQEFSTAEAFANQFEGSPDDLERALRADSEYMTDGDINSVVDMYRQKVDGGSREKKVKYDFAFGLIESNFNPAMLQSRDGELVDAVRDSKKDVDETDVADYFDEKDALTSEEEMALKEQLDKAQITKNPDGTFTITIDGESRTYKKTGSGAGDITRVS